MHVVNSTFDGNSSGIFAHGGVIDVANSSHHQLRRHAVRPDHHLLRRLLLRAHQQQRLSPPRPASPTTPALPIPRARTATFPPQPVYMNAAQRDFRPTYGSPLIDAGNGTVPNYPATDAFGIARYNAPLVTTKTGTPDATGKYPDIGAFEFVQSAPSNLDFTVSNVNGPATRTWSAPRPRLPGPSPTSAPAPHTARGTTAFTSPPVPTPTPSKRFRRPGARRPGHRPRTRRQLQRHRHHHGTRRRPSATTAGK